MTKRPGYDQDSGDFARVRGGIAHESGELHRLLVESVRDYAIFALDPNGYVLSWNPGAQRIKGYAPDEIIGRHFSVFYPQEKIDTAFPDEELRVAAREGRFEDEGWRIRKDGTRFWASVIITALRSDSGELEGFAKVTRDLTERREATLRALEDAKRVAAAQGAREAAEARELELGELTEKLKAQALELEGANRTKAEFLASMSHELRTPLNAIGGYVDLLITGVRGPLTEMQIRDLERVRWSQQHLLGIINDILNFTRMEAGQISFEIGEVRISEVVANAAGMIAEQATAKGLRLVSAGCPPDLIAMADKSKVEQILLNLISNAIKYTNTGEINVSCGRKPGFVTVAVRDTGIGIAEDQMENVFDPFVQLGRSLSSAHEGTGLGLSISRNLAQGMGGSIEVSSRPGEGSTFTLLLKAG